MMASSMGPALNRPADRTALRKEKAPSGGTEGGLVFSSPFYVELKR
jgi:hypothetical protein